MLTIQNLETIVNQNAALFDWVLIGVNEFSDIYEFEVLKDDTKIPFYLNRESQYMSGRNEPVYRLYKSLPQSSINRWLSINQISPQIIKHLIDKMLNE